MELINFEEYRERLTGLIWLKFAPPETKIEGEACA